MAHGACANCGCSLEECSRDKACPPAAPRSRRKASAKKSGQKMPVVIGDYVRVRRGHRLEGAAGLVKAVDRKNRPAIVTVRQLNGTELRLPLGLVEFVSYSGAEPDVL